MTKVFGFDLQWYRSFYSLFSFLLLDRKLTAFPGPFLQLQYRTPFTFPVFALLLKLLFCHSIIISSVFQVNGESVKARHIEAKTYFQQLSQMQRLFFIRVVRKLQFLNNFLIKPHFCRALARKNARL